MKKLKIDQTSLTDEQRDKLDSYNAQQQQLTILQDIADMTQEMLNVSDKGGKESQKSADGMGSLLVDIRESLDEISKKEDPESPDYSKPIVEAVNKLEKALKAIDVKPEVKVSTPDIKLPSLDLTPISKILKEDIPKAFEKAISLIPKYEMPEPDNQPLLDAWEGISEQLLSIETATRMKPIPGKMAISNFSEVTDALNTTTNYTNRCDTTTTASMIYVAKAEIGSDESSLVWQLKRINTTTIAADIRWADGNDSFDNSWTNRASASYL